MVTATGEAMEYLSIRGARFATVSAAVRCPMNWLLEFFESTRIGARPYLQATIEQWIKLQPDEWVRISLFSCSNPLQCFLR